MSGLNTGAQVTVLNNAGDPTTVKANGSFSFPTPISYGGSYAVTVGIQPPAQICTVTAAAGSGVVTNVSGVSVACAPASETVLYSFAGGFVGVADGGDPNTLLIQGSDGNFYGTSGGGIGNNGSTDFEWRRACVPTRA